MLFNTPVFLLFFLLVVPLSFLVPRRWQNFVLLAASYFFYGFSDPKLILLLLGVTAAAYLAARGIRRRPALRKLWKVIGILVPLLLLFNFKYFGFFARLISSLTGGPAPDLIQDLVLPTGISFYTFQALSYVIDADRGEIEPEANPLHLALYLSFFPQLVAGPIERARDLLPQIRKPRTFDPELAVQGLKTMLIGFFEKIAVADILGIFVNRIWGDLFAASGADVLQASFFFSLQILCDFKGYSDIARGAAGVLGIRLSVNFDRPYSAASVGEFWRRWHITFSSWLKDYLYIPLGGSRGGFLRWSRNLLIVFFVSGLWHGADLTFVAWGLVHALFQIAERLLFEKKEAVSPVIQVGTDEKNEAAGTRGVFPLRIRQILTFLAVNFAWVLFRAADFSQAGLFFTRLFDGWQKVSLSASGTELFLFAASLLGFAALSFLPQRLSGSGKGKKVLRYAIFTLALWLTAAAYLYLRSGGIRSSFIYFQF